MQPGSSPACTPFRLSFLANNKNLPKDGRGHLPQPWPNHAMPFVLTNSLSTPIQNFVAKLVELGMAFSKTAVFSSSKRQGKGRELSITFHDAQAHKRTRLNELMEETESERKLEEPTRKRVLCWLKLHKKGKGRSFFLIHLGSSVVLSTRTPPIHAQKRTTWHLRAKKFLSSFETRQTTQLSRFDLA